MNRSHARGTDKLVVHGAVSVAAEDHQLRVQGRRTQALAGDAAHQKLLHLRRIVRLREHPGDGDALNLPRVTMRSGWAARRSHGLWTVPRPRSDHSQLALPGIASSMAHSSARWPAAEPSMPHTMMCSRSSTTHLQCLGPRALNCALGDRLVYMSEELEVSSKTSSSETIRSPPGIAAARQFSIVVLPAGVPPATTMFWPARTAASRNRAACCGIEPRRPGR